MPLLALTALLLPPPPLLPCLPPRCSAFEASVFFISVLLAIVVLQVRWEVQPPVLPTCEVQQVC